MHAGKDRRQKNHEKIFSAYFAYSAVKKLQLFSFSLRLRPRPYIAPPAERRRIRS